MSDPTIAAAPQAFTFGELELRGHLTAFSGSAKRRSVDHEYPKRDAADVEDMGARQRRLAVRLVFLGPDCASDYANFKQYVSENPAALLVHPVAGRWQAYTDGPDEEVDFEQVLDRISVRIEFKEDGVEPVAETDTPDAATAAQAVTAQLAAAQLETAQTSADAAKQSTFSQRALDAIDKTLATLDAVADPLGTVIDTLGTVLNVGSEILGKVLIVYTKMNILSDAVENFVDKTNDLFSGDSLTAGEADAVATLLGSVEDATDDAIGALIDVSPTPAGAADAVGALEETLAACYVLDDAVKAARPPTVTYVVPELMSVIEVAARTGPAETILARASQILQLNHVPNPAAISRGSVLEVPTE